MKKLLLFLLLSVFLGACEPVAEPETHFFRILGSENNVDMAAITVNYDTKTRSYYIMGYNWAEDESERSVWIYRMDEYGRKVWLTTFSRYINPTFELRILPNGNLIFLAQEYKSKKIALVTINTDGSVIDEWLLDEAYSNPSYLIFAYEQNQMVMLLDKKGDNGKDLCLMSFNPASQQINWEKTYPKFNTGKDIFSLVEKPAILFRLSKSRGYTFLAYDKNIAATYVCFVDDRGNLSPSRQYLSTEQLRNYTETNEAGKYAAIYGEADGGSYVVVHSEEAFDMNKYHYLDNTLYYFLNEINPQFASFVRPTQDSFMVTATSYLGEIIFIKLRKTASGLDPYIRKIYGSGDRIYYARSRPNEHPEGGYFFLGRLDFGKQFPVWRACLIKTDIDGNILNIK